MSNHKLVFYGSENSGSESNELYTYVNNQNQIFIEIKGANEYPDFICLDRATAIKFVRTMKAEISKIERGAA